MTSTCDNRLVVGRRNRLGALVILATASLAHHGSAVSQDYVTGAGGQVRLRKGGKGKGKKSKKTKFYSVRRDYRECLFPRCGGWFVKAVNEDSTRCSDSTYADECYVAKVDFGKKSFKGIDTAVFLTADTNLVFGELKTKKQKNYPGDQLGVLKAKDAWYGAGDTGGGPEHPGPAWSIIKDNGIRCFADPCFSTDQEFLNTAETSTISSFDLSRIKAPRKQLDEAYNAHAMYGLHVGGENAPYKGEVGEGVTLIAKQFYLPLPQSEDKKSKKTRKSKSKKKGKSKRKHESKEGEGDEIFQTKYLSVRRDFRKCIYPMCGGWWVMSANEDATRCFDGEMDDECYAAEIDYRGDGDIHALKAQNLVFGYFSTETVDSNVGRFGILVAEEAWYGAGGMGPMHQHLKSVFSRLVNNGIVCIRAPCFSLNQVLLNTNENGTISGITFKNDVPTDNIEMAREALNTVGLHVTGENVQDNEGVSLAVEQFYLPLPDPYKKT